mgnify:CR=1 FL=1
MCTTALSDQDRDDIKLLDERVVASALGVSQRTVQGWRQKGCGGPPYIHIGTWVKYPLTALREFIRFRRKGNGGSATPQGRP